jgi:hypothetical protein
MNDVLRIEKDGEVIWEGEINGYGMVLDTKMMIKPVYDKIDWFAYTNDVLKDTTYKTEPFKHMTLKFESVPVEKHQGQFPNAITQAAYEKAMEDYALAAVAPPTDEEVAEALEKAADLFITEGWAQGGYHVSKTAAMAQSHGVVPTAHFIEEEEEC